MDTALWVMQVFLAAVFAVAGTVKLALPRARLARRMHWAAAWPPQRIQLLGLAEVAGALGLVLPAATSIAPVLTPLAAVCLAVLMVGAARTHQRLGEAIQPAVIAGVLCVATAAGRVALLGGG